MQSFNERLQRWVIAHAVEQELNQPNKLSAFRVNIKALDFVFKCQKKYQQDRDFYKNDQIKLLPPKPPESPKPTPLPGRVSRMPSISTIGKVAGFAALLIAGTFAGYTYSTGQSSSNSYELMNQQESKAFNLQFGLEHNVVTCLNSTNYQSADYNQCLVLNNHLEHTSLSTSTLHKIGKLTEKWKFQAPERSESLHDRINSYFESWKATAKPASASAAEGQDISRKDLFELLSPLVKGEANTKENHVQNTLQLIKNYIHHNENKLSSDSEACQLLSAAIDALAHEVPQNIDQQSNKESLSNVLTTITELRAHLKRAHINLKGNSFYHSPRLVDEKSISHHAVSETLNLVSNKYIDRTRQVQVSSEDDSTPISLTQVDEKSRITQLLKIDLFEQEALLRTMRMDSGVMLKEMLDSTQYLTPSAAKSRLFELRRRSHEILKMNRNINEEAVALFEHVILADHAMRGLGSYGDGLEHERLPVNQFYQQIKNEGLFGPLSTTPINSDTPFERILSHLSQQSSSKEAMFTQAIGSDFYSSVPFLQNPTTRSAHWDILQLLRQQQQNRTNLPSHVKFLVKDYEWLNKETYNTSVSQLLESISYIDMETIFSSDEYQNLESGIPELQELHKKYSKLSLEIEKSLLRTEIKEKTKKLRAMIFCPLSLKNTIFENPYLHTHFSILGHFEIPPTDIKNYRDSFRKKFKEKCVQARNQYIETRHFVNEISSTPGGAIESYIAKINERFTRQMSLSDPFRLVQEITQAQAQFSANTLTRRLQEVAIIAKNNHNNSPEKTVNALQEWTQYINPKSIDRTTLEMLSNEQCDSLLTSLEQLSQSIFASNFYRAIQYSSPETMVAYLELMTLADMVMAYSKNKNYNLFEMPLESFSSIIDGTNPFFIHYDPHLALRIQGIRDWLNERREMRNTIRAFHPIFNVFDGAYDNLLTLDENPNYKILQDFIIRNNYVKKCIQSLSYNGDTNEMKFASLLSKTHTVTNLNTRVEIYHPDAMRNMLEDPESIFGKIRRLVRHAFHHELSGFPLAPKSTSLTPVYDCDYRTPDGRLEKLLSFFGEYRASLTRITSHVEGLPKNAMEDAGLHDGKESGHGWLHMMPPSSDDHPLNEALDLYAQKRIHYKPGIHPLAKAIHNENSRVDDLTGSYWDEEQGISTHNRNILATISAEPDLQIQELVSYTLKNPSWLNTPSVRSHFLRLLFDSTLLIRELQHPVTGPNLIQQLSQIFAIQSKNSNEKDKLFFVEAGIRFNHYREATNQLIPYKLPFPKELEKLVSTAKEKLQESNLTNEQRSAYGALHSLTFFTKNKLSNRVEAIELLNAVLTYRAITSTAMVNDLHINRQINLMMTRFSPQIKAFIEQDQSIINDMLKGIINTQEVALVPSQNHPLLFTNQQGTLTVDPLKGTLAIKGALNEFLPPEVIQSKDYQLVHKNANYRAEPVGMLSYRFTDHHEHINFVQKQNAGSSWSLYKQFPDHPGRFRFIDEQLAEVVQLLPYTSAWYCEESNLMRLLDDKGVVAFRIELKGQSILGIYNNQGQLLAENTLEAYHWTNQFELKKHVNLWLDPVTHRAVKLEFPRLDRTFHLSDKGWTDGQWVIAARQNNPIFPGETNFLRLKNEKGVERVLMPLRMLKQSKSPHISSKLVFDQLDDSKKNQLLIFDREIDRKFKGVDDTATLYLAMLKYAHLDYQGAHQDLANLPPILQDSEQNYKILDAIINNSANNSPQAIVARHLAASIKKQYAERFTALKYEIPPTLLASYKKERDLRSLRSPTNSQPTKVSGVPLPIPAYPPTITESDLELIITKTESITPLSDTTKLFDPDSDWYQSLSDRAKQMLTYKKLSLEAFQNSLDTTTYSFKSRWALQVLSKQGTELEQSSLKLKSETEELKLKILQLANPLPQDPSLIDEFILQQEAGTQGFTDIGKILKAFGENKLDAYQKINPRINQQQAELLDDALQQLMDLVPYLNHQSQLVKRIRAIEQAYPTEHPQLLKEFYALIKAGRQYIIDPKESRAKRVLESQGHYFRQKQIQSIIKLGSSDGINLFTGPESRLLIAATGEGKSTFIAPVLIRETIEAGKLALLIMPEPQLPTVGKELAERIQAIYNIPTIQMTFSREHIEAHYIKTTDLESKQNPITEKEITNESLKEFHLQLQTAYQKGHPVLISAKSHRSFSLYLTLAYRDYLQTIHKNDQSPKGIQALEEKNELVQTLFAIDKLFSSTTPIIDEVATVFNSRLDTTYVDGMPTKMKNSYGEIALLLYNSITSDRIQQKMHFNFFPRKDPDSKPFTKIDFKEEIAPILIDDFLKKIKDLPLNSELNDLKAFITKLKPDELEKIKEYVLQSKTSETTKWIGSLPAQLRNELSLLRGQIQVVMPLTLHSEFGVDYGFASSDDMVTVPFSAEDKPTKDSQFSSEFVQFNYNIQAMFFKGIPRPVINRFVGELRAKRLEEEIQLFKSGKASMLSQFVKLPTDKAFSDLFSEESFTLQDENLEDKIAGLVSRDPKVWNLIMMKTVLPLHEHYEQSIKATSQTLGNSFLNEKGEPKWVGMTATPKDEITYPGFHAEQTHDAAIGRTIYHILQRGEIHVLDNDIEDIFSTPALKGVTAAVDGCGIYFANKNKTALITKWARREGKSLVTIDPKSGPMFRKTPEDTLVPFESDIHLAGTRISFYDNANYIGTNIPHEKDAIFASFIDENMSWGDVVQTLGRDRGMGDASPTTPIKVIFTPKALSAIKQKLGLEDSKEPLTIQQLVNYYLLNSFEEENKNILATLKIKLRAVIETYVRQQIKEKGLQDSFKKNPDLLSLIDKIFVPIAPSEPWDLFGQDEEILAKKQVIDSLIQSLIGREAPLAQELIKVFGNDVLNPLKLKMEKIAEKDGFFLNDLLPNKQDDSKQTQEVEQHNEQLAEQEQETAQVINKKPKNSKDPNGSAQLPLVRHKNWEDFNTETVAHWSYWTPRYAEGEIENNNHLLSASRAIGYKKETSSAQPDSPVFADVADLFDSDLAVTTNFQHRLDSVPQQKPARYAVVVKSQQGNYRVVLIDQREAARVKKALWMREGTEPASAPPAETGIDPTGLADSIEGGYMAARFFRDVYKDFGIELNQLYPSNGWQVSGPTKSTIKPTNDDVKGVWLVDLNGRPLAGSGEDLNLSDPTLLRSWVQMKVFAGEIDFEANEIAIIKKWLQEWLKQKALSNPTTNKQLWIEKAKTMLVKMMERKEDAVQRFPTSALGKIFGDFM